MSEEDDEQLGKSPVDPPGRTGRRAFTKDWSLRLDRQEEAIEETKRIMDEIRKIVGSNEENPEMTKKLERLEAQFDALAESVTEIRVSIGKIDTRLDGIERNLVSKGQAASWALIAGMAIFAAGWWVVQQYLSPLLANLPKIP